MLFRIILKLKKHTHSIIQLRISTRLRLCLAFILPLGSSLLAEDEKQADALHTEALTSFKKDVVPFVKENCVECHGNRKSKAGLNLEVAVRKPGDPAFNRRWTESFANVNAYDMPPEDADQPSEDERRRFLDAIAKIKYLSARDPGPFVIRRLTKAEYGNTLHDLLGVDVAVAQGLPEEVPGEGYLNSLSPMQTEQYLSIASEAICEMPPRVWKHMVGTPPTAEEGMRATAQKFAQTFARKAYRRPPSTAEVGVLMGVFDLGRKHALGYEASLRLMLKAVLVSPQFLFITPAQAVPSGQKIVPVDDFQLASRLSYFLWATMPDEELSALADAGKLHDPKVLKTQVARLLSDPRSHALFEGFGAQWLGMDKLVTKPFDAKKFPQMTPQLRKAMVDEARLFFDSIVRGNRGVSAFIDSDYTFLNETLAEIYGMEKTVTGAHMRRVQLADANRGGILGMPGVLAMTSFPDRTSPVNRGVWVLEQVLGEHVPPAPPNVPTLEKQDQKKVEHLTLRQRTELHRADAVCANCHKILDPIGFGLENFDAIGRWRENDDSGGKVDAAGELPGGRHFSSPRELKAILAARQEDLARNLTEKLMAFALCRQIEGYDHIVVDQILKTARGDGYRVRDLITEVVVSYPFLNRRVADY